MSSNTKAETHDRRLRAAPIRGTHVIWAAGLRERYGVSDVTIWRWLRDGKLPAPDVHIGGRHGHSPQILAEAERGPTVETVRESSRRSAKPAKISTTGPTAA